MARSNEVAQGGAPTTGVAPVQGVTAQDILSQASTLPATPGKDPVPGPRGKDRFNKLLESAPAGWGGGNTEAYAQWLWSVPDDPTDPEFSQLLHERQRQLSAGGYPAPQQGAIHYQGSASSSGFQGDRSTSDAAGRANRQAAADQKIAGIERGDIGKTRKREAADQDQYRQQTSAPIITGMPVDAQQILSDAAAVGGAPVGIPSAWLKDFTKDWDLGLEGDYAGAAAKSGDYVYVGQANDPNGGPNFKRDKYVYKDDAKASVTGMDPARVKAVQAKLGLPQTGLVDPTIAAIWDDSVEMAGRYARNGQKVTLDFIFDTLVSAQAAGRSGGGGGNGLEKGAVDQAGVDYYMAMMQVLGDISGVKSSNVS